ncbi:MAG TPA: hypothetical protein QGF63_19420 [Alphaproteobacteria bacterium]|nr:hypothetical protein [Alphaproteobacteria bacterium]
MSDDPQGKDLRAKLRQTLRQPHDAERRRWSRRWREVWWMFWICWIVGLVLTAYLTFWQQPLWQRATSEAGGPSEALGRHNDETRLSLVVLLFLLPLVAFAVRWLLGRLSRR